MTPNPEATGTSTAFLSQKLPPFLAIRFPSLFLIRFTRKTKRVSHCWVSLSVRACWSSFTPKETAAFALSAHEEQPREKEEAMKKDNPAVTPKLDADPDMLDEYDFSGGKRGMYAERYAQGTNLVALSPDIAAVFPDSESVNDALRTLVRAARRSVKPKPRKKRQAA
jgi:hypothetical protein